MIVKPTARRQEEASIPNVIRRLGRFVRPYRVTLAVSFLLLLVRVGVELLKPWPLKFVFDDVLTKPSLTGDTLSLLIGIAALVVVIALLDGLLGYVLVRLVNGTGRTIVFDIRVALFDHLQRLSLQFHSRTRSGDLMTRVTGDVKAMQDVATGSLLEVLSSLLFFVFLGAVLLWLDWQLALVVVLAIPLMFLLLFVYTSRVRAFSKEERKREGALASVLHENLGATRLVRVFAREDEARRQFEAESAASLESGFAAALAGARFSVVVDTLRAVVLALVLGFGAHRVVTGAMSPGDLIVFVSYVRNFYKPMRTAMREIHHLARAIPRAERVLELLDEEQGVTDLPGAVPAPRFHGELEFRDVSFGYEPGTAALHAVDLTIPARRMTAIVGPTGAGKTTLVSLIPRLFDPTEGEILIDGRNVKDYTLASLRSQVSMVLQESVLLQSTIADNIRYGRAAATYEEIVAAAKAANAHDFIAALPDGYDTVLGERGDTLSGGQRQRIAIARAMIRDAPILLLDEPLTGLDALAADAVGEALERLMAGRTVITITHQLAAVQRADQIVVLEGGRVVQQGTHRELVETEGRYRDLFRAQFRDFVATGS